MLKALATRLRTAIPLTISSTQTGAYNLYTAAGSPAGAVDVYLTINTGVVLEAGLIGTGFAAGSTITIVNNGRIAGIGGGGGNGIGIDGSNAFSGISTGSNGGHAVETNVPTYIDNTNGEIFGGGGGGAGGSANRQPVGGPYTYRAGGGGGGGGQGYNLAGGGAGGVSIPSAFENGVAGSAGSWSAPGAGGAANAGATPGNSGGGWGANGIDGYAASAESSLSYFGGLAGQAVKTNSAGLTWLGGNNVTQVKGTAA